MGTDPYSDSILVQRLRKGPKVGIYDLDHTLTGPVASQLKAHELINRHGPMVINTARETGMVMSSRALEASRKHGYRRSAPKLGTDPVSGKRIYAQPESIRKFAGHLNPSAIVGFGGGVLLRQQRDSGYAMDESFSALLGGDNFRTRIMEHLRAIDLEGDLIGSLAVLEDESAFLEGRIDVEPLYWRIQINPKDEVQKTDLKFRIATYLLEIGEYATVKLVDESRPWDNVFTLYIVPKLGTKQAGADHLLRNALTYTSLSVGDLSLTMADDAFTGLRMATDVLPGAKGTFVLPGKAPVAEHLMPSSRNYGKPFAGEDVSWLLERLTPTETEGVYDCFMPGDLPNRRFIIADQAVPGFVAADSILALDERGLLY